MVATSFCKTINWSQNPQTLARVTKTSRGERKGCGMDGKCTREPAIDASIKTGQAGPFLEGKCLWSRMSEP